MIQYTSEYQLTFVKHFISFHLSSLEVKGNCQRVKVTAVKRVITKNFILINRMLWIVTALNFKHNRIYWVIVNSVKTESNCFKLMGKILYPKCNNFSCILYSVEQYYISWYIQSNKKTLDNNPTISKPIFITEILCQYCDLVLRFSLGEVSH